MKAEGLKLTGEISPGHHVCLMRLDADTEWTRTQLLQYALKALDLFIDPYRDPSSQQRIECRLSEAAIKEIEQRLQLD